MRSSRLPRRRGFALLTALWMITAGSVLAAAGLLVGRQSAQTARNRVNAERAFWRAEDCVSRARWAIDDLLADARTPEAELRVWRTLDTLVARVPLRRARDCTAELHAAGTAIDVNAATPEQLYRLFVALYGEESAASLSDALLDWRDADNLPRPFGAEADWYQTARRHLPRNDSIASARELARVRGLEELAELDGVLDVEPGRISIANAPPMVLASVPGFTEETIGVIVERRLRGEQVTSLLALGSSLSSRSADSILAHFPEISRMTTLEPDAWILTARGTSGDSGVEATIELRLVRAGKRAAILRRRSWS
jgi:general secretion pathway protein K